MPIFAVSALSLSKIRIILDSNVDPASSWCYDEFCDTFHWGVALDQTIVAMTGMDEAGAAC